jgi:hypothetical protein
MIESINQLCCAHLNNAVPVRRPKAGFVAKTYKDTGNSGTKGDKIFLNIVSSDKITTPTRVDTDKVFFCI